MCSSLPRKQHSEPSTSPQWGFFYPGHRPPWPRIHLRTERCELHGISASSAPLLEFVPLVLYVLKMLVDDFLYLSSVSWRHVEAVGFLQVESVRIEPILSFCISLAAVHMDGFIAFIGIEEQSPSHHHQYSWHPSFVLLDASRFGSPAPSAAGHANRVAVCASGAADGYVRRPTATRTKCMPVGPGAEKS